MERLITEDYSVKRVVQTEGEISLSLQELATRCWILEEIMKNITDAERSLGKLILQVALIEVHRELEAEIFFRSGEIWIV